MQQQQQQQTDKGREPNIITVRVTNECWSLGRAKYASDAEAAKALTQAIRASVKNVQAVKRSQTEGYTADVDIACYGLCIVEDARVAYQATINAAAAWAGLTVKQ